MRLNQQANLVSDELFAELLTKADSADAQTHWPNASWTLLVHAGITAWSVPEGHGGRAIDPIDVLSGYERLAGACLTTTFILSQREAAVRRIRDSGREDLARDLLGPLARGETFATVGLSQLTTSRQHGAPALTARETQSGFILDGSMPWVTGADRAQHLVAGAVLDDGRQVILCVPTDLPGVHIDEPLDLAALRGSRTSEVHCRNVDVPRRWLLAGPALQVLSTSRGGTGGLETSCLAIGHAGAAIDDLLAEASIRPDLRPLAERLDATRQTLRGELHDMAASGATTEGAIGLRARANALALRATQAALTASKGAGFVRPHAAQRRARQALFFLVWSCPRAAAEATLCYLNE